MKDLYTQQRKEWLRKNFKQPIPQWVEWAAVIVFGVAFGSLVAVSL